MEGPTAAVALLASVLCLLVRPGTALGVVIASMLIWPEYLRLPMGPVQFSVPRIAALVLVLRLIVVPDGKFRWRRLDTVVVALWGWNLVANVLAGADEKQLVYMIGNALDTALMYFVARLALSQFDAFEQLIVPVAIAAILLGVLGAYESTTSHSPYDATFPFARVWFEKPAEYRMGFLRAKGSTAHPIYFGIAMFLLAGMLFALRGMTGRWRGLAWAGAGFAFLGALSSLSSGPQVALVLLVACNALYFRPQWIMPALWSVAGAAATLEVLSNRHFYHLLDYIALSEQTGWYRARLLEVAVAHLGEYWLFGYGGQLPHHWAADIDGRDHVDVVNHFILRAMDGGLVGLALYLTVLVLAVMACRRVWRTRGAPRSTAFALGALVVSLSIANLSVGLFSAPLLLASMLPGLCANLDELRLAQMARGRRRTAVAAREPPLAPQPTPEPRA